jgi:hypothetical protein
MVMLIVSEWSHGPARATTAEITAERADGLPGRRLRAPDHHRRSRPLPHQDLLVVDGAQRSGAAADVSANSHHR